MTNELRSSATTTRPEDFQPSFVSSMAILESLLQAQRVQLETLNSYQ